MFTESESTLIVDMIESGDDYSLWEWLADPVNFGSDKIQRECADTLALASILYTVLTTN